MKVLLTTFSLLGLATPAAAQINLPPQLTYDVNENYGPDPGPPSDATPEPEFTETHPTAGLVIDDGPTSANYISTTAGNGAQSKARFTCVGNDFVAYLDGIRGPNARPYGHLHDFFGLKGIDRLTVTYTQARQLATTRNAAGMLSSSCPGDAINGSLYWEPALLVPNAMNDGVTRAKKRNLTTLYYQFDNPNDAIKAKPFKPGFRTIFGRNMDDPNMLAFKALVDAAKDANPALAIDAHVTKGHWSCETGGGADTLANLDGTPAFECPADKFIAFSIISSACWNGKLASSDGFSTTLPDLFDSNSGKRLCPKEYRWRLVQIETITRFSHRGSADYSKWRFSSDDHIATLLNGAVPNGSSGHVDYIYGWRKPHGEAWQCSIGIQFPGRTCTPHDLNFSTIGPLVEGGNIMRLQQGPAPNSGGNHLISLDRKYTGAKLSDWVTIPPISVPGQVKGNIKLNAQ